MTVLLKSLLQRGGCFNYGNKITQFTSRKNISSLSGYFSRYQNVPLINSINLLSKQLITQSPIECNRRKMSVKPWKTIPFSADFFFRQVNDFLYLFITNLRLDLKKSEVVTNFEKDKQGLW